MGNLFDEKEDKNNAIFMYQKAINADPKYYKTYYNLGNIYLEDEKYTFAIENYKKAIKLNKENPYVYYNLACAYIKTAELKKAKNNLIKAGGSDYHGDQVKPDVKIGVLYNSGENIKIDLKQINLLQLK